MACSMHLVLLVAILLSLAGTPETVPIHRGRGGWTLNSAGYLLGPVLHLPSNADQGRKRDSALEILDLWKAIDGLPYSRSPRMMTKRSLVETFIRPKNGDVVRDLVSIRKKMDRDGIQYSPLVNGYTPADLQVLDRDIPSEAALNS